MPRRSKVEVLTVVDAICPFADHLKDGSLPPYTNEFYTKVAKALDNEWTRHQVYINLRENRRELRSKVFERIGITHNMISKKEESCQESLNKSDFLVQCEESTDDEHQICDDEFKIFSVPLMEGEQLFDLIIRCELWERMKPITKNYNGRSVLVLPPGIWADIIADEFWMQYRLPCAFSFKKNTISLEDLTPFLRIIGKCKSSKCNNAFLAFVNDKPIDGADLWLQVRCRDTRMEPDHEEVKRELRFQKRQDVGKTVLRYGAANTRRKIALEVQNIGNLPAPNLYKGDILRKLLQECKDKELNVNVNDGNNPIFILLLLKYRTPYCGSIYHISADKFQLQYLLPEQRYVFKEYCRLFPDTATICLDSTGSLVKKIEIADNVKSPVIFLYEIVINFNKTTISVGQMLSAAQDTNSILFWLNNWLKTMKIIPREAVSDYSRALLGAMSLAFNNMSLKDYIKSCYEHLINPKKQDRPANTFLRIDVAHLIQIFCRLKCFTKSIADVKDFYLRCIALMVSCDNFKLFETILYNTLVVSIQKYDGDRLNSSLPSPAEAAREKLSQLISEETHAAMKLIPDEKSEQFNSSIKKLYASGFDVIDPDCFLNQEADVDQTILKWLENIQVAAETDKDVKHSRINGYFIPQFFNHLLNLAKEFPLWTAVNRKNFISIIIRPTSCYVESEFGEVKHNVLNNVHGSLRADKFFKFHFEALKAQALIASSEIAKVQISDRAKTKLQNMKSKTTKKIQVPRLNHNIRITNNPSPSIDSMEIELDREVDTAPSTSELLNKDLFEFENWKNKVQLEFPYSSEVEDQIMLEILPTNDEISEIPSFEEHMQVPKHQSTALGTESFNLEINPKDESLYLPSKLPNSDLFQFENWKNKGEIEFQDTSIPVIVPEQMPLKKTLEVKERKPSKYFGPCSDFKIKQKIASNAKVVKAKERILINGSFFHQPIVIANKKFLIKNTCAFDSIVQILVTLAFDSPRYLKHIEETESDTFGFILVFLETGAVNHVYGLRCLLLKDYNPNPYEVKEVTESEMKISPYMLRSVNVHSNVTEMWKFLMQKQPSVFHTMMYSCGHLEVEEIPSLFLNHKIIEAEGFKCIEKAIITRLDHPTKMCPKDECGFVIGRKSNFTVNAHVFLETDVRKSSDLQASVTCKVEDFPLNIVLHEETLRLGGIIVHVNGNHYMSTSRRLSGRWELYNDCAKTVTTFPKKKVITPHAAIYLKNENEL